MVEQFIIDLCVNAAQAYFDDFIRSNVNFRSSLGMREYITRNQLGNCCDWCANLAGTYEASKAPADIYRRHRDCRCVVLYKSAKGYQDVWTKTRYAKEKEARNKSIIDYLTGYEQEQEEKTKTRKRRLKRVKEANYEA